MKNKILFSILFLTLGVTTPSLGEVFKSHPLPANTFTLGIEPEVTLTGDSDFSLFMHAGYGIARGYALQFKVGFGHSPFNDDDVHFSGMLDIPLVGTRDLGLFTSLGISNWGKVSIENQLIFHFGIGPVSFYTGVDDAVRVSDSNSGDDVEFPIEYAFGLEVPVRKQIAFLFEGGIKLNDSSSYVSGGFRFYF